MSTPKVTTKNVFFVHARDLPNAQREKHTPEHMKVNAPLLESGYVGQLL